MNQTGITKTKMSHIFLKSLNTGSQVYFKQLHQNLFHWDRVILEEVATLVRHLKPLSKIGWSQCCQIQWIDRQKNSKIFSKFMSLFKNHKARKYSKTFEMPWETVFILIQVAILSKQKNDSLIEQIHVLGSVISNH